MHVILSAKCLAVMMLVSFTLVSAPGDTSCQDTLDCARLKLGGYTCQNFVCVCDPTTDTGLFSCRGRMVGDKCLMDYECAEELNLICSRNEPKTCRCRRGYMWNKITKSCYLDDGHHYDNGNKGVDPVRDAIVLGFVLLALGAFVYVGIRVFCTCGKYLKRQHRHLTRELDDVSYQQQDTWVASYRVVSSLNGTETRSSPGLSPNSSFPLHPTPCMGLFLPSGSLAAANSAPTTASTTSPPSYEEALKHKVVLSSLPRATTAILPTAQPIQGPPNNMPGGTFMCNSQGGLN